MMQTLPSDSVVLNALTLEKEIFWTEHSYLLPEQIQLQWANKNAKLTSLLGPAAPTERFDLTSEPRQIPQLTQPMIRAQSVRRSNLFSAPPQRTDFGIE